ncbi:hypothetical protein D3C75_802750 [compost metagenome]
MVEEQPHQRVWQQPEEDGEHQHHRRAKTDPDAAGVACAKQVTGTVIQPHTHGHGIRQARRNHERRGDDLQGDLVRRQLGATEHTHAQCGEGEQADLDGVGAANRQAQAPQLAQGWPRRAAQALANRVGRVGRVPADIQGHGHGHAVGHDGGDQTDTHQPQFRQAEHALDQRIVEQKVGHGADQADDHHRR